MNMQIENWLVNMVGEEEGGTSWESSIETYTLPYVKFDSQRKFVVWHSVLPIVRVPSRKRRLLETMQLEIGEFITDSSQGLLPSPRVWGRKALSPSSLGYLLGTIISWRKWIGYTVGSWHKQIGYTVASQFFVGPTWGFQLSPDRFPFFLLGICWLASSRRPDNYVTPGNQAYS